MSTQLLERPKTELPMLPVHSIEADLHSAAAHGALRHETAAQILKDIDEADPARKAILEQMAQEAIRHAESLNSRLD